MKKPPYVLNFLFLPVANSFTQDTLPILHPVVADAIEGLGYLRKWNTGGIAQKKKVMQTTEA